MKLAFIRFATLMALILALPLLACRQEPPPTASPNANRYDLRGKVVSFDKARREVTIAHEIIPGYMEAMTMPFTLNEEWVFDVLTPGAQIQATLVVDGAKSWIETPTVTQMAETPEAAGATPGPEPEPGMELPDFTLVNQDGEKISLRQFRGEQLVLTFIYTRCPLPDYCPLMTRNFGEIGQSLLRESRKTRLLSVTIDPAYAVEWAFVHHFWAYNYYVYQYATSIAAGTTFARRILRGGKAERENYLDVLRAGGSDYPVDLLKRAGLDMTTPVPYRELVADFAETMDRIEQLL